MLKTYTTTQGDMWDSVAYKVYGSEAGINALLEANQEYADVVVFPANVVLQVPDYIAPESSSLPPWRR